jgi:hypothetical protein
MFVKEHDSNRYIFIKYDDYACKRFFYDELIRIQYNKVYAYPNTIDELDRCLKKTNKQIYKGSEHRY